VRIPVRILIGGGLTVPGGYEIRGAVVKDKLAELMK
jgi:hypothetical protein